MWKQRLMQGFFLHGKCLHKYIYICIILISIKVCRLYFLNIIGGIVKNDVPKCNRKMRNADSKLKKVESISYARIFFSSQMFQTSCRMVCNEIVLGKWIWHPNHLKYYW